MSLLEILSHKENVYHLEGASDEDIAQAELSLGLRFADDYRECLRRFSLLSYDSHELTGICNSSRLNVVDATLRERLDNKEIPENMYLIEMVGVENLTIWQNSNGGIFEVGYKEAPHKIFDSLYEYIEKQ